jgi:phage recombination protein Bet
MVTTEIVAPSSKKNALAEQITFSADQLALMKNTVAKGATDDEFLLLLHLAKTYGLDPFAKEIWCIKYGNNPATIFSSCDGYLKIASRDKQMNGIVSDAVCANDMLERLPDGRVKATYGNPRGELIGAYAFVERKDRAYPAYFYAPLKEYCAGSNPTWKKYPTAMIIKVAEAMALKRAFSISGLVTQEEIGLDMQHQDAGTGATLVEEPAAVANPLASVEGEPLTAHTRKLILLAVDAYDVEASKGEGAEARLLDSLDTMTEDMGKRTLRFVEKQPKKKAPKLIITEETTANSAMLVQEFRDRPTVDGKAPAEFATPEQKQEIKRLVHIPAITRP